MDLKVIKQVVELMKRSEISEFEIEEKDFKLRLTRKNCETQIVQATPVATPQMMPATPPVEPTQPVKPAVEESDVFVIKSPMVGTFYRASSPESPSFAKLGETVTTESVVCIIEAMKVMNEIHAETTGTITEVLVENGEAVEYGQPLFKVKTA